MTARKSGLEPDFFNQLRRAKWLRCHVEDCPAEFDDIEEMIKGHFTTSHQDILNSQNETLAQLVLDCRKSNHEDDPEAKYPTTTALHRAAAAGVSHTIASIAISRSKAKSAHSNNTSGDPVFGGGSQSSDGGLYELNDPSEATAPIRIRRRSNRARKQETRPQDMLTKEDFSEYDFLSSYFRPFDGRLIADYKAHTRRLEDSVNPASGSKSGRNEPRSFLPVLVEGNAARALPDTEAGYNVVTEKFAVSMGAALDRNPHIQRTFTNAVGREFQSCGIAELNIALPRDAGKGSRSKFAVLKKCAEPLVLGYTFLKENEIFTKVGYSHDLVKEVSSSVAASSKKMFRVMHMEQPRQKLTCALDSKHALANADTGSDIDLVSLHYAQSRGWDIKRLSDHEESYVMLADEEEVQLDGYVEACLSVGGNEMMKRFYVLQGLVCDVILGDPTLESLDVFKNFNDDFVDWSQGEDSICMITWVKRFGKVEEDVEDILGRLDHAGGLSEGRRDRPWLRSIFSRRINKPHRTDLENTKYQLQSQLHKADSIETEYRTEFAKKEYWLKDDALRREQEEDGRRREKHDQLRRRILKHIDNLSNQGREPGDPRVAKAEHAVC